MNRRHLTGFSCALALALTLAVGTAHAADAADASPNTVNIDNFTFGPNPITVHPGTTITFTNRDDIPHTVVTDDGGKTFKSKVLDTGDSFTYTFTTAGTFAYHCSIHPNMKGRVIVQ